MTVRLVIVGAGGFGRETLDVIQAVNSHARNPAFEVLGVVDDAPSKVNRERLAARGVSWIGGIDDWLGQDTDSQYIIGVGNPIARASIDARLAAAGRTAASAVHPKATIGSLSIIGPGSVVCSGVQISTNVVLGRHVHINPNATVGHDVVIDDYVSVNPAAIVSGEVTIGSMSLIGAAAVILQGLAIGPGSVVGASACVTRDVAKKSTVMGIPARRVPTSVE